MILVLSFDHFEQCTDPVIDWLLYYKANVVKITLDDLYKNNKYFSFDINKKEIYYDNINLINEINSIYYRRFIDNLHIELRDVYPCTQAIFELKNEVNDMVKYFFYLLKDKKWLPAPDNIDIDKLTQLNVAQECGLKIPATIIANSKTAALHFLNKYNAITKPIHNSGSYILGDNAYKIYTSSITSKEVQVLQKENFFPTLFQEKIEKDFEIRVFYLDKEIYATAIILDDGEYEDVKLKFNSENINWIPYTLPVQVEDCIIQFMAKLNLNTGSLDMMKSKSGDFIFIEVNPVGQFIAPGRRCNYYLEEKIAKWLINHDRK